MTEILSSPQVTGVWSRFRAKPRSVRFDVFIDGELADTETIMVARPSDLDEVGARQSALCHQAEADGKKYLVDIAWWDGTHNRWGTDSDGMVVPIEVGVKDLMETLVRLVDRGVCNAVKFGYVCQRGGYHEPPDLHAQLVKFVEDGLWVSLWREGKSGVLVTKLSRAAGAVYLGQDAVGGD